MMTELEAQYESEMMGLVSHLNVILLRRREISPELFNKCSDMLAHYFIKSFRLQGMELTHEKFLEDFERCQKKIVDDIWKNKMPRRIIPQE
jgi:hypothetical protein